MEELSRLENDNANKGSEEIGESGQFKNKVSYALLQIEDFEKKLMNPNILVRGLIQWIHYQACAKNGNKEVFRKPPRMARILGQL